MTELTDRIRSRASPDQENEVEDSAEFVSFFPDFVWSLRDMTLKLEVNGVRVTADEYLENSLKLKEGTEIDTCRNARNLYSYGMLIFSFSFLCFWLFLKSNSYLPSVNRANVSYVNLQFLWLPFSKYCYQIAFISLLASLLMLQSCTQS